jgi:LacI family transcriptional regulator
VILIDVAQDACVSWATASLVLRDSPLVADETREKVLALMEKLDYVYNRAAACLWNRCSQKIGLIFNDITDPFFSRMTVRGEAHLDKADYGVPLSDTLEKPDKQDRLSETMYE